MHRWAFMHQTDTLKRITRSWCTFQNPAAGSTCLSNCHYQNQYRSERASERATERTQPPPSPPPSYPLQTSSHLLSNALVFISRLNKCLFLQHARTRWFLPPNELVQTPQHFLPPVLVARVIEVSVLVLQPNTPQTQDAGNICLHCATYRQLVCRIWLQAAWNRNRRQCDRMKYFKHWCLMAI